MSDNIYFLPHAQYQALIKIRFNELIEIWHRETRYLSSTRQIVENEAYQEIIKMGIDIVPFILQELSQYPDHWFVALKTITGEDPVPAEIRGNMQAMAKVWINWGEEKGLI